VRVFPSSSGAGSAACFGACMAGGLLCVACSTSLMRHLPSSSELDSPWEIESSGPL
jgi:hypothetical protein